MWIIRNKTEIYNIDVCFKIYVDDSAIIMEKEDKKQMYSMLFDNERMAKQHFSYILEGLKNKQEVIYI